MAVKINNRNGNQVKDNEMVNNKIANEVISNTIALFF